MVTTEESTAPLVPISEETYVAPAWDGYTVALPSGEFVVYWERSSYSEETGEYRNYLDARRFDASGVPMGEVVTVYEGNFYPRHTVAFGDGSVGILCNTYDPVTYQESLVLLRTDVGGMQVVSSQFVAHGYSSHPETTVLADGSYVVAWGMSREYETDPEAYTLGSEVYIQRFDAEGNSSGAAVRVNTFIEHAQDWPDITALADGGFLVTWESSGQDVTDSGEGRLYDGVYAQRFDAHGQPVGGEFQVNTTTHDDQYTISSAGLTGGGFVVVWEDWSPTEFNLDPTVSYQVFDSNSNKIGGEHSFLTSDTIRIYRPEVAALPDGGFALVFQQRSIELDEYGNESRDRDVYLQRFDAEGNALGGVLLAHVPSDLPQERPRLSVNDDGQIILTWRAITADNEYHVITRVFDIGYAGESNTAPVAVGDLVSVNEDMPLTLTVADLLANDTDADGDLLSITAVFGAEHGTVSQAEDGTILFVAEANFNGTAAFHYTVSDPDGVTSEGLVTVAVAAVYDPLVTIDDALATLTSFEVQTVTTASLLANDLEGDGGALAIASVGDAVGGQVLLTDGVITFVPDYDFVGTASFRYEAVDGVLGAGSGLWGQASFQVTAPAGLVTTPDSGGTTTGSSGDNVILGGSGGDRIDGRDGNDTLVGGAGDDTLIGGKGDDIFLVAAGDGVDTFSGGLGTDTLQMVGAGDLTLGRFSKGDTELIDGGAWWERSIEGTEGKDFWDFSATTLKGFSTLNGNGGDDFIVGSAGGETLLGGAGKDHLNGGGGDDILDGGVGNDLLTGGSGNDIYRFGLGGGKDSIDNLGEGGSDDWVQFGAGVASDHLWFQQQGDDLVVSLLGTQDQLTLTGWGLGSPNQVAGFATSDGATLSASAAQGLLDAMANFAPPPADQTELSAEQHQALDGLLASSWQSVG